MYKVKEAAAAVSPRARRKAEGTTNTNNKREASSSPKGSPVPVPVVHHSTGKGPVDAKIHDAKDAVFKRMTTSVSGTTHPAILGGSDHRMQGRFFGGAHPIDLERQQWFTEPTPFAVPVSDTASKRRRSSGRTGWPWAEVAADGTEFVWSDDDLKDLFEYLRDLLASTRGLGPGTSTIPGTSIQKYGSRNLSRGPMEYLLLILEPIPASPGMLRGKARRFKELKKMLHTLMEESESDPREMSICFKAPLPELFILGVIVGEQPALEGYRALEHYLPLEFANLSIENYRALEHYLALNSSGTRGALN